LIRALEVSRRGLRTRGDLLSRLLSPLGHEVECGMDLSGLRDRIDSVDRQIIALLAERLKIVEEVATAKLDAASPFRDREREERLLLRLRERATEAGLDPHEVERLYRVVMDMSVAHQEATV